MNSSEGDAKRSWIVSEEVKLIPEKAFNFLPFSSEPFSEWDETTDLLEFLYTLHDKSGVIIAQDGTRKSVNYRDYGKVVYDQGLNEIQLWIRKFEASAKEAIPAPA